MKINKVKAALMGVASVATMVVSSSALAWGQTGHRVTGEIAQQYLSPLTQAAVAELLPSGSLAQASTYADEMRSEQTEFWQKTASPWHYVTVPHGKHYHQVGAPKQGDAYSALQSFTETLKSDTASKEEKQLALRFIVHIIGDLHQPLHVGNGNDRGGNDIKVRFFWNDSNLHRVWDSQMLEQRGLSYTEWSQWLVQDISGSDIQQWASIKPEDWMAESIEYRDELYPQDANNMNYQYLHQHLPTAKQRLQQAGIRIAMYLNDIFDQKVAK